MCIFLLVQQCLLTDQLSSELVEHGLDRGRPKRISRDQQKLLNFIRTDLYVLADVQELKYLLEV